MTATTAPPCDRPGTTATGRGRTVPAATSLAGFTVVLRFLARRDRLRAPIWVVGLVTLFAASTASVVGLYSTPEELRNYASFARADAAIKAVTGPGYGLDTPTQGAVVMNEVELFLFVGVALMSIFTMIRHTRRDEETECAELVRAAPVGRNATLIAALVWVGALDVTVAVGLASSSVAFGLPLSGSVAFGAAAAGVGLVFGATAAVTAQVASSARAATAGAGVALGASFMVRAVGDLRTGWLTWLSPLGWSQAIRAYDDEQWWVLFVSAVCIVVLVAAAIRLSDRRDLGAGLLKQHPGPAGASRCLTTPLGLTIRLQRTSVLGWTVGVGVLGFFYGLVADQADQLAENQAVADILAQAGSGTLTQSFLATVVLLCALIASGFTVSTVLRLRAEEIAGRADTILATPVSRRRWVCAFLGVSAAGSAIVMTVTGLMIGAGYAVQVGDAGQILPSLGAALAMVPALLVLAAFAVALYGIGTKWAPVAWAGVVVSAVVGLLGVSLNLPGWLRDLSPFHHVPALPAAPFDVVPLVLLTAVAVALTVIGVVALDRRDVQ